MTKKYNYSLTIETTDLIISDNQISKKDYEDYLRMYMNHSRHLDDFNLLGIYELETSVCHKFIVNGSIRITLWKF